MANKKTSKSNEAYYARYKQQNVYASNRRKKLSRLLKKYPNNKQIEVALKETGNTPKRSTPKAPKWSHTAIREIMLEKYFKKPGVVPLKTYKGSDYAIKLRAHDAQGNLVWV